MGRSNHHVEQLVIPVAGALNCEITAKMHLDLLVGSLQAGSERVVADPVVPAHFGLYHLDEVQDKFTDEIQSEAEKYPNAKIVIVGHSLGGLLGRSQDVHGLVTIGTPHEGTRWYVPGWFRHQYEAFSQNPPSRHIGSVAMIGSSFDEMVHPESSLARSRRALEGQRYAAHPYLLHNVLPVSRSVKALTAKLVNEMFHAEAPSSSDLAVSA